MIEIDERISEFSDSVNNMQIHKTFIQKVYFWQIGQIV